MHAKTTDEVQMNHHNFIINQDSKSESIDLTQANQFLRYNDNNTIIHFHNKQNWILANIFMTSA